MSADKSIAAESVAVVRHTPEYIAAIAAKLHIGVDEVTHIHLQGSLPDEPSKGVQQ